MTLIAQTGAIEEAVAHGIEANHFVDEGCKAIYSFCVEHVRRYAKAPSYTTIRESKAAESFLFEPSTDAMSYLLDTFVGMIKRREVIKGIETIASYIDDSGAELGRLDEMLMEVALEVAHAVPGSRNGSFSQMGLRIADYRMRQQQGSWVGINMGIPTFDVLTQGIQPHEFVSVAGWQGTGKALALDTPVPTPTGWSSQGELKIGDEVFNGEGDVCVVVAVGDILLGRPCREVLIAGGESIVADAEHEWVTRDSRGRKAVRETDQIRRDLVRSWSGGGTKNHSLSLPSQLECPDSDLPIDPYVLGVWLGDGHSKSGRITTADPEIPVKIDQLGYKVTDQKAELNYGIAGLQTALRDIGVFGNKHIPQEYLRAGVWQRVALLQGLMDTDGHADARGSCEFCTTNEKLADGVMELICSLGFKPGCNESVAVWNGKDCGPRWRIVFRPGPNQDVFSLKRKVEIQREASDRSKSLRRHIESVEPVKSVPVRCIQVSSDDGTYLVGRTMVPTHNSTLLAYLCWHAYLQGKKPLIFSLEMDEAAVMRKFDLLALNWERDRAALIDSLSFKGCELTIDQELRWEMLAEQVRNAANDIIVIDDVGSPTLERLHAEIARHRPDMVGVDYVSLMQPPGRSTENIWQDLTRLTRGLKLMARTLKTPIVALAQTNLQGSSDGAKLENIAYSRSLGQDSDIVLGLKQDEEMRKNHQMTLRMLKNRDGAKGEADMLWEPSHARFGKWEDRHLFERDEQEVTV